MVIMMKKENLFWLLVGIVVAFGIQVLYEGAGEYPDLTRKFWYGLSDRSCSSSWIDSLRSHNYGELSRVTGRKKHFWRRGNERN
jgi:hypothetical protein